LIYGLIFNWLRPVVLQQNACLKFFSATSFQSTNPYLESFGLFNPRPKREYRVYATREMPISSVNEESGPLLPTWINN